MNNFKRVQHGQLENGRDANDGLDEFRTNRTFHESRVSASVSSCGKFHSNPEPSISLYLEIKISHESFLEKTSIEFFQRASVVFFIYKYFTRVTFVRLRETRLSISKTVLVFFFFYLLRISFCILLVDVLILFFWSKKKKTFKFSLIFSNPKYRRESHCLLFCVSGRYIRESSLNTPPNKFQSFCVGSVSGQSCNYYGLLRGGCGTRNEKNKLEIRHAVYQPNPMYPPHRRRIGEKYCPRCRNNKMRENRREDGTRRRRRLA